MEESLLGIYRFSQQQDVTLKLIRQEDTDGISGKAVQLHGIAFGRKTLMSE